MVFDHGVPRDYQNVAHIGHEIVPVTPAEMIDKKEGLNKLNEVIKKLHGALETAQAEANISEEEKEVQSRKRRHMRGHLEEGTRIQIQEHDEADRID